MIGASVQARLGLKMLSVLEVEEGVYNLIRAEYYIRAVAAGASVRRADPIYYGPEPAAASVSAVTGFNKYSRLVYERRAFFVAHEVNTTWLAERY